MEFKLDQNQIKLKKREYLLSLVFISIILLIGTIGIIGPKITIGRCIATAAFAVLFILIIKHLFKDFSKTRQKMVAHRLIIANQLLILQQDVIKQEFDLNNIYSILFHLKKGSATSIVINISKNVGFTIKGYERMDEIMRLLENSVPSSRIKSTKGIF